MMPRVSAASGRKRTLLNVRSGNWRRATHLDGKRTSMQKHIDRTLSESSATLPEVNASPTSGAFIGSASRKLCSHLKHDFAWSVACGAVLKHFTCASKWKHLG